MQLNDKQRDLYSDKAMDFGILAVVALSFGSLLSGRINWWLVALGRSLFGISYLVSYWLTK